MAEPASRSPEAPEGDRLALPSYVTPGTEDETRWRNAVQVAVNVTGQPETSEAVWSMARVLYHDRVTYPD